jgi:hypothetical protein
MDNFVAINRAESRYFMKTSPLRMLAAGCLILIGMAFFVFVSSNNKAADKDFISYWATGQQLAHRANPYDAAAILRVEQASGLEGDRPLVMRNPPNAFFLAAPLGWLSSRVGLMVWSCILLTSLVVSIRLIWQLHGRQQDRLHLLGYCFAPVIACLLAGQIGIFLLLGIVLFLYFLKSRPFFAGASLLLCAVKPHLFLSFALVLLAWGLTGKSSREPRRVLAGGVSAMLASCALAFFLDPQAWQQYWQMMHAAGIEHEFIPTLSTVFRLLVDRDAIWPQFVPSAIACVWGLWYYFSRSPNWSWQREGLLVLIVSVACSPYAWFSDEAVLLPAVLGGVYSAQDRGRSLIPFGVVAGVALMEVFIPVKMTSPYYLWTVPAWLAWFLYATGGRTKSQLVAGHHS